MLDPFAHPALSVSRLSKPALLTAVVLHLGLLWVALNSAPMVRSVEQVVYQWVAPITPQRDVSVPITLPTPVTTKTIAPPVWERGKIDLPVRSLWSRLHSVAAPFGAM